MRPSRWRSSGLPMARADSSMLRIRRSASANACAPARPRHLRPEGSAERAGARARRAGGKPAGRRRRRRCCWAGHDRPQNKRRPMWPPRLPRRPGSSARAAIGGRTAAAARRSPRATRGGSTGHRARRAQRRTRSRAWPPTVRTREPEWTRRATAKEKRIARTPLGSASRCWGRNRAETLAHDSYAEQGLAGHQTNAARQEHPAEHREPEAAGQWFLSIRSVHRDTREISCKCFVFDVDCIPVPPSIRLPDPTGSRPMGTARVPGQTVGSPDSRAEAATRSIHPVKRLKGQPTEELSMNAALLRRTMGFRRRLSSAYADSVSEVCANVGSHTGAPRKGRSSARRR